jgi:hypothetical protein
MTLKLKMALLGWAVALGAPQAQAATMIANATGQGWCSDSSVCNNSDVNTIASPFVDVWSTLGTLGTQKGSHDWFAFQIPNFHINSATISIWSDSQNYYAD